VCSVLVLRGISSQCAIFANFVIGPFPSTSGLSIDAIKYREYLSDNFENLTNFSLAYNTHF